MRRNGFAAMFSDKINWLLVGALAVLGSGASLNAGTTAFFTDTETVASNSFTTASVDLGSAPFSALSFTKIVPGDVMWRKVNVFNGGDIRMPYYVSIKQDTGDAAYSSANGLHVVAVRCFDEPAGAGDNVDCESPFLESVQLINGIHGATTTIDTTDLSTVAIETAGAGSSNLNINGTLVAGKRIQTADNGSCTSTTGAGACLMGGPVAANTVSNPAITSVTLYGAVTAAIPSGSGVVGVDSNIIDHTALFVFIPTTTTSAQLGDVGTATFTVAYTGVQPNGSTTATNGSFGR